MQGTVLEEWPRGKEENWENVVSWKPSEERIPRLRDDQLCHVANRSSKMRSGTWPFI